MQTGTTVNDCATNPEIINGGKGITNEECYKDSCNNAACIDNPSILVCEKKGTRLSETAVKDACGAASFDEEGEITNQCTGAITACAGKCDTVPGCMMNSEAGCGNPETPAVPSIRVVWDKFNDGGAGFVNDGKVNNKDFGDFLADGLKPDKGSVSSHSEYRLFLAPTTKRGKLVAGTDGTLGAAGIEVLNGSGVEWRLTVPAETDCTKRKVSMKIFGDGRKIKITGGDKDYEAVIDQWTLVEVELGSTSGTVTLKITTSTNDSTGFKMMRLDEIKVEAVCKPESKP